MVQSRYQPLISFPIPPCKRRTLGGPGSFLINLERDGNEVVVEDEEGEELPAESGPRGLRRDADVAQVVGISRLKNLRSVIKGNEHSKNQN